MPITRCCFRILHQADRCQQTVIVNISSMETMPNVKRITWHI